MAEPPVPRLIPPLRWRAPAFIWTPLALALGIGWPWVLMQGDGGLANAAMIGGAVTFAIGLVSLGAGWGFGKPPRTYRDVIAQLVRAGLLVSLLAPFVLTSVLDVARGGGEGSGLPLTASLTMVPLALLIGLPAALVSGVAFAVIAFIKPPRRAPETADARELFP